MKLTGNEVLAWDNGNEPKHGGMRDINPVRFPDDAFLHPHAFEWWYLAANFHLATDTSLSGHSSGTPTPHTQFTLLFMVLKQRLSPLGEGPSGLVGLARVFDHRRVGDGSGTETSKLVSVLGGDVINYEEDRVRERVVWNLGRLNWTKTASEHRLTAAPLELALVASGPPRLRLGDKGVVDYGEGRAGYFIAPRLSLSGMFRGRPVQGFGWFERQWTDLSPRGKSWRFILARLEDGTCLSAFVFEETRRYAVLLPPDKGEIDCLHSSDFRMDQGWSEQGPVTQIVWDEAQLVATITSLSADQEFTVPLLPSFGEYASRVEARIAEKKISGWAITECAKGNQRA